MNFLSFYISRLYNKQAIRTLLLSLVFLSIPIALSQACAIGYQESILLDEVLEALDKIPEKLNGATFEGNVELTRVTVFTKELDRKIIARAIVEESKTHPDFVGKKMLFFYDARNICHYPISRVGDRGFAMGRALKLGSEVLYVVPYVLSFDELEILTESESIPLSGFYPNTYQY